MGTAVVTISVAVDGDQAHLLYWQKPLMQSQSSLQIFLLTHFAHFLPPQSMSVSPGLFLRSMQVDFFSSDDESFSEDDECLCEHALCLCECGLSSCADDLCLWEVDESSETRILSSICRAIQSQQQITSKSSHT